MSNRRALSLAPCHSLGTRSLRLVLTLLFAFCWLPAAFSQSPTATLGGTVEDERGAVVPGATITVTNNATGVNREAVTNAEGYFTMPLLQPGAYTLKAQHEGFRVALLDKVVLNVGDQKALRIPLKTGDVRETVNVTTEAPLINESPAISTTVDRQFVENVPLNGRTFQSLINLTPGVVVVPGGSNASGQFSVNGQRASANSFMVDGVSANFGAQPAGFGFASSGGNTPGLTAFGTTQSLVSLDALQEFKIQTSNYSAEYGRQPGSQVSIITRSGTNQFHGSLFDYIRNDVFDANDWFANRARQPKAKERQNDFGGTFSGPVFLPRFGEGGRQPGYNGRSRTFFFLSYEGLRLRLPQFSLTNVPTLLLRQQAPPGIQPVLNAFPLPNGKDLGKGLAEFSSAYSDPSSLDATSIRIDHTVNSKLSLFGRFNKAPSESIARRAGVNLSSFSSSRLNASTVTVGATLFLTPSASNDVRVNYSKNGSFATFLQDDFGGATPPPRNALIPTQYDVSPGQMGSVTLQFTGLTSTSSPNVRISGDLVSTQRQFNIVDNFSFTTGPHQLKVGIDYRRLTPIVAFNTYSLSTTFLSQQQVIAATAASGSINASLLLKPIFSNFSAYANDDWKPTRHLTLNLGVRWEVNPAPSEANGNNAIAVTQIDNLAAMRLAPLGMKEWKTTYNNFAPRLGIAYGISRRSGWETVLRSGFGVFYDTGNDVAASNFNQIFPYASARSLSNVSFPLSPSDVAPAALPINTGLKPPYSTIWAFDPALRLPYTLQWNIGVQQSLGTSQALTVSYVGAAGRRLVQATQQNVAAINPLFTSVRITRNSATSDYHGLQAQFQRRLSRGLQALVSYTWSHALDDDSVSTSLRVAQRGNANFDVRHILAAAATYDFRFAGGDSRLARATLGGWSIDANFHAQSALPVDIIAATLTDPADGSQINVRPNLNPGVALYISDPTVPGGRKINRAAFSVPPSGQSGNFGRNQLRGFGAWQFDAALRRQFKLTEKLGLQFRAEAFNLFNHPNFGTIQTSLTAANFGEATNMLNRQLGGVSQLYQIGGPRSFQFALKLMF